MATAVTAAFVSVFRLYNRELADVDADLRSQGLQGRFRADQDGRDEVGGSGFNSAAEGYVSKRPNHGGGDGREIFATLDELLKDVVVGGMADKRIDSNGFSQRGKVAHESILRAGAI